LTVKRLAQRSRDSLRFCAVTMLLICSVPLRTLLSEDRARREPARTGRGPSPARRGRLPARLARTEPGARRWRHTSAYDKQSSRPVAKPDRNAPPVNGDEVRAVSFNTRAVEAYRAREVDDLLRRVAAELDAGRPVGQLIKNATLRKPGWIRGMVYDADAVDWFLGQLLLPPGQPELDGISDDPWRDLAVAQLTLGEWASFETAWRDFGQLPGTRLWWGEAGRGLTELRTAEQHTLASVRRSFMSGYLGGTVSTGGRSFTYERRSVRDRTEPDPETWGRRSGMVRRWYRLTDETGTPILYESCRGNFDMRAPACIKFPDQRWLRFLVRGRGPSAIMTAVDQAGSRVVRYRFIDKDSGSLRTAVLGLSKPVEIIVHPSWKLTDQLTLALAISGRWLDSYFERPSGGGG